MMIKSLLLGNVFGIEKRLHRCLAKTVFAGVGALPIVLTQPYIEIRLKLLERSVKLFTKRDAVKLFLDRAMEAFADAISLRRLRLCSGVIYILQRQIELILVGVATAAVLGTAVR